MAEVTMCKGYDCPIKDECYRYMAIEDKIWQTWFVNDPRGIPNKMDRNHPKMCAYFDKINGRSTSKLQTEGVAL